MSTRRCVIWLHQDYIDYLEALGPLNEVVNLVLDNYWEEGVQYQCPDRVGAIQRHVAITSDNYFAAVATFGPSSYRASIRRVLYYFVDMELGDELQSLLQNSRDEMETIMDRRKQRLILSICDFASRCKSRDNLELCQSLLTIAKQIHSGYGGY